MVIITIQCPVWLVCLNYNGIKVTPLHRDEISWKLDMQQTLDRKTSTHFKCSRIVDFTVTTQRQKMATAFTVFLFSK